MTANEIYSLIALERWVEMTVRTLVLVSPAAFWWLLGSLCHRSCYLGKHAGPCDDVSHRRRAGAPIMACAVDLKALPWLVEPGFWVCKVRPTMCLDCTES